MSKIRATVVIPAFNAAATLGEQLAALAAQSDAPPFEVVVSDNGSSDQTLRVAEAFVDAIPGLRVVDASARRGPSAARNAGAAVAHGDVLLFCDADDRVDARWVAELTRALDRAELAGGAFEHRLLNEGGGAVSWDVADSIRLGFWPEFAAVPSSNLGVRAEVFRALGGFDEELTIGEDTDLCWRAQLAGNRLAYAPEAIVHHRKRSGLRAVYRQARAYGAGGRVLEARYALVAASFDRAPAEGAVPPEPEPSTPARPEAGQARSTRLARRALAVRGPGDLADLAWRLGEWRGARAARPGIDPIRPERS